MYFHQFHPSLILPPLLAPSTVSLLLNRNIDSDDEKKSAWLISPNLMTPVLCISLKMISFHSFLWLNSTPLCIYNIAFLIGSPAGSVCIYRG